MSGASGLDVSGVRAHTPTTGIVWDERYLWHHPGGGAGVLARSSDLIEPGDLGEEGPLPRRRFHNLLQVSGVGACVSWVAPRAATPAELGRVHDTDYVDAIRSLSAHGGGDAGGGTPFGANGYDVAALAAGGCLRAVELVLSGELENAYALVKPAGHHASSASGDGHCIFNNVAVAATHAIAGGQVSRVTIVDWDVHWGNGTYQIFAGDPAVQFISLHQADWYPRGGGDPSQTGDGDGLGSKINIALPPGSGIGAYRHAFTRIVLPAIEAHRPELILVSCGFDASANDPSGRMLLTSADFAQLTGMLLDASTRLGVGRRIVVCHEGGYSPTYVPFCGLAVIEELCAIPSEARIADPFLTRYSGVGFEGLQAHQAQAIDDVLRHHRTLGKPSA